MLCWITLSTYCFFVFFLNQQDSEQMLFSKSAHRDTTSGAMLRSLRLAWRIELTDGSARSIMWNCGPLSTNAEKSTIGCCCKLESVKAFFLRFLNRKCLNKWGKSRDDPLESWWSLPKRIALLPQYVCTVRRGGKWGKLLQMPDTCLINTGCCVDFCTCKAWDQMLCHRYTVSSCRVHPLLWLFLGLLILLWQF